MIKYFVLAGGAGSRLWPYSRSEYPKQVLKLLDGHSLIQNTFLRLKDVDKKNIHIITNGQQRFLIEREIDVIGKNHPNLFIEEPYSKNTAAAICLATLSVDISDIMVVLPSDQAILQVKQFNELLKTACKIAEGKSSIVTLGITPTHAETGYGYIEVGASLNEYSDVSFVKSFKEKPNREKAENYLSTGKHLWNSGMFIWKAKTILDEFKQFQPDMLKNVRKFLETGETNYFNACEIISIDYAILEKSNKVSVVRADIEWSDLGNWNSVFHFHQKDYNENCQIGSGKLIDSHCTNVKNISSEKSVFGIGLENTTIINTDDAVLVCSNDKIQDVKKVVDELKVKESPLVKFHKTVYRPWGYFKVLEDTNYFKSKRLVVYPGQSISLQYHHHRSEVWTVVAGKANIIKDDKEIVLSVGETVTIPVESKHRIINKTKELIEVIEVQTGSYFGEDDIVRLEDQYSRENSL